MTTGLESALKRLTKERVLKITRGPWISPARWVVRRNLPHITNIDSGSAG